MTHLYSPEITNLISKNYDCMPPVRILIVEDEPAIAQDISIILSSKGYNVVGIAHSSTKAMDYLTNRKPDLALLDISIKGDKDGIDIADIINQKHQIPFIYLTSFADQDTINRVKSTAPYGYIVKPFKDSDLAPAIEVAMLRKASETHKFAPVEKINREIPTPLTSMEYQVAKLIWEGNRNQEMADSLFLSINTVKTHISNLYTKTQVNNKSALIQFIRKIS